MRKLGEYLSKAEIGLLACYGRDIKGPFTIKI